MHQSHLIHLQASKGRRPGKTGDSSMLPVGDRGRREVSPYQWQDRKAEGILLRYPIDLGTPFEEQDGKRRQGRPPLRIIQSEIQMAYCRDD